MAREVNSFPIAADEAGGAVSRRSRNQAAAGTIWTPYSAVPRRAPVRFPLFFERMELLKGDSRSSEMTAGVRCEGDLSGGAPRRKRSPGHSWSAADGLAASLPPRQFTRRRPAASEF